MAALKSINLALAFLLELLMLLAFAVWGFQASDQTLVKILLGIGVPLVVIAIWSTFLAPRAARRLSGASLRLVELIIFGLAALALAAAGHADLAIIFAIVVVVNQALLIVWSQ